MLLSNVNHVQNVPWLYDLRSLTFRTSSNSFNLSSPGESKVELDQVVTCNLSFIVGDLSESVAGNILASPIANVSNCKFPPLDFLVFQFEYLSG